MKWLIKIKSILRILGTDPVRDRKVKAAASEAAKPAPVAAAAASAANAEVKPASDSVALEAEHERDLLELVRQAHTDWACAQQRLNFALDKDQIDYAIYTLEAAEKRYSMLLKQAKMAKVKADGANAPTGRKYIRITG
ncbi:DUF2508 family protein [Paenibacillus thermotolerans]|uniref:DUF2508 family protein n=1 Tax=Paenibacillus thermotolerans TaxID=3027807 RepID=UPI002367B4D3|nr:MULTISPECIES: DUF2508 family protein [unclassified Paenibacillus]